MATPSESLRTVELRDGRSFLWRSATPADAPLVWSWWTAPEVSYWSIEPRLAPVSSPPYDEGDVALYLHSSLAEPRRQRASDPLIGIVDGAPIAYAELWTKRSSPISSSPIATSVNGDARGMHLVVADRRARLRGLTAEITVDAIDWQFAEWPSAQHCLADPDVRNKRAIGLCARVGMKRVGLVELPYKAACVMAITRAEWREQREGMHALLDRRAAGGLRRE